MSDKLLARLYHVGYHLLKTWEKHVNLGRAVDSESLGSRGHFPRHLTGHRSRESIW